MLSILHAFCILGFVIGVLWAFSCLFSNGFSEILIIALISCVRRMRVIQEIGPLQMTRVQVTELGVETGVSESEGCDFSTVLSQRVWGVASGPPDLR